MANIPTLKQLFDSIISDLESEFSTTIPLFGKSWLRGQAAVQAAKLKLYYILTGKLQKNIWADTADSEATGGTLERFGRVKLKRNPFPAVSGTYEVTITGDIGAVVPAGTVFKSNDDSLSPGQFYQLDNDFTLTGPPDNIDLRALETGLDSKLEIGNELTLTAPIALVNDGAVVITEVEEPVAAETIEVYRSKTLDAYQLEPQGGAGSDYRLWAADVPQVLQSYPFAVSGANNEVNLFIEATLADSTDGKGTPSALTLSDVTDAIENPTAVRPSRKPLAVFAVNYLAVTIKEIDIEITEITLLTAEQKLIIFNAIKADLVTIRPFVASIDILAKKNDIFDTNKIVSLITEAIPGIQFGAVVLKVDTVDVGTFTFENGDIPNLNTIIYV